MKKVNNDYDNIKPKVNTRREEYDPVYIHKYDKYRKKKRPKSKRKFKSYRRPVSNRYNVKETPKNSYYQKTQKKSKPKNQNFNKFSDQFSNMLNKQVE